MWQYLDELLKAMLELFDNVIKDYVRVKCKIFFNMLKNAL